MTFNWAKINSSNIVENICVFEEGVTPSNENLPSGWYWVCDNDGVLNQPSIGGSYNSSSNGFIDKKLFNSWTLNTSTCRWEAPVAKPSDGKDYNWNEESQGWELDSDYNE